MKTMRPNILDVCLHKAGFKSKNNPATVAGLFNEFQTPTMEEGVCPLKRGKLEELTLQEQSSIDIWNCSGGDCAKQSLYIVEFKDSTTERVTPNPTVGLGEYCSPDSGETISDCVKRNQKKVKRVIHIIWNYSEWNELERYRSVTIYS